MAYTPRPVLYAAVVFSIILLHRDKRHTRMVLNKTVDALGRLFRSRQQQLPVHKVFVPSLVSLPPELLIEMLKELGWRDVLTVRQTCRALDKVSRTKSVWKHFLDVQATEQAVPWGGLEKPVELYQAAEIERLVLRWQSVNASLDQEQRQPHHETRFDPLFPIQQIHLLRGGRWILLRDPEGGIHYCDLEAPEITASRLIPCPFEGETNIYSKMAVDETRDTPLLSFRIATFVEAIDATWMPEKKSLRPRIDLYQVDVILDSHKRAVALTSILTSTFRPGFVQAVLKSMDLFGPHVACLIRTKPRVPDYVDVFNLERLNQQVDVAVKRNTLAIESPINPLGVLEVYPYFTARGVLEIKWIPETFASAVMPSPIPPAASWVYGELLIQQQLSVLNASNSFATLYPV
ncbi:hypothetical protein CPB83DRAFT_839727 [Crepidotus variabilis]|uniref:F-box domain-containing protein n=1 Tax=Crepidotus variabilis TaxID=179855 RepID=A0A9P6E6T0_9AGAR|nr:hypothetical protein CPB83DRAFT_839727 [Crepidotus variabilis]